MGVLAGAFFGLGAVLATTIGTGSALGYGPTRWLAGLGFSLGLILVVVAAPSSSAATTSANRLAEARP